MSARKDAAEIAKHTSAFANAAGGKLVELEETARVQNDEVGGFLSRYQGLKAWHLMQKSELREQIGESLMLQYALADYGRADRVESMG